MTNEPISVPSRLMPPLRHASLESAAAWIEMAIAQQPLSKPHGYVKVDDHVFHMANTACGHVVSLLQWRLETGKNAGVVPVHNLFAVDLESRDKAVESWLNRTPVNELSNPEVGIQTNPTLVPAVFSMKPARSGAR